MPAISIADIAERIAFLRPAPPGSVEAAKSLPALRSSLDDLVERCRADQEVRARVLLDLEQALEDAGVAAEPGAFRYVRLSLDDRE